MVFLQTDTLPKLPQDRPSIPLYTNKSPIGLKRAFFDENRTSRKRFKIGRLQAGYKLKKRHNNIGDAGGQPQSVAHGDRKLKHNY